MNEFLRQSLDRTLLLMRDELRDDVDESVLIDALTETEVVLAGDAENLSSHAAQCAFVTAALLMARSGHQVTMVAPDVRLVGEQAPLKSGTLIASLLEIGRDLLPGIEFSVIASTRAVDLCVVYGDTRACIPARRTIGLNASRWSAYLHSRCPASRWDERVWPYGSLAAGALAAGEAFKASMHKIRRFARAPQHFDDVFAFSEDLRFDLAPPHAPMTSELDSFDFVSGGAIVNAALYCLSRIPRVTGAARVIEDTTSDYSNLNRYALLRRSQVFNGKVDTLRSIELGDLTLQPVPVRYDERSASQLAPLAPRVLVGVDHIPTRWFVQRMQPRWLGIGATTHWSAMTSYHERDLACGWCLHPRDDAANTLIPTVAFVSFWSGLLLASQFVRSAAGEILLPREQHAYLTPFRPESIWRAPVAPRPDCPLCGQLGGTRAA
jgi:hypothetical protein